MTFLWLPGNLRGPLLNQGGFSPAQVSAVSSWLRLAASVESGGGEWEEIADVLAAGSPAVQTDADRLANAALSANNLPTAQFDGSDVYVWPLTSGNNATTKTGFWIWFKPGSVASVQHLVSIVSPTASAQKLDIYANNAQVFCECYISGVAGRFGRTGNVLTAGAWTAIYVQYDSSRGGDANLAIFINGVSQGLTYGNLGAGGTLTTLPVVTGNALIGGLTNSDTPSQPIANNGELGPNLFSFTDNLTAGQIASFLAFEAPTA